MRMMLIASVAILGLASAAQANQSGATAAKFQNNKHTTKSYLGRQNRGQTTRKYVYDGYPTWAARAFQPSQNR